MKKDQSPQKEHEWPQLSEEQRLQHEHYARTSNYEIALHHLADLKQNSIFLISATIDKDKQTVWADHEGNAWITGEPMGIAERETLAAVLEVVTDYERDYAGEQWKEWDTPNNTHDEQETLRNIADIRAASHEPSRNRLAEFNRSEKNIDQKPPLLDQNALDEITRNEPCSGDLEMEQ